MTLQDTLTFEVDFNDVDRNGRLMASRRFASSLRVPDVGDRVYVSDDEGNYCWGEVVEVDNLIVYIDLDRSTWKTPTSHGVTGAERQKVEENVTRSEEPDVQLA